MWSVNFFYPYAAIWNSSAYFVPTRIDRIYSETEIQLIMKVLHGAPITANGTLPWDITEPISVELDQESVKEDCKLTKTLVIDSAIQHEQAGSGLFAGILQF